MFRKFILAALIAAVPALVCAQEDYGGYKSSMFYEIRSTEFLSENNEFNTEIDALSSMQITPYWVRQTNLDKVPEPDDSNVKVCIVDSGVSSSHEDLHLLDIEGTQLNYPGAWEIDSVGHGTHIAGIIGATNNNYGVKGAVNNGQVDVHVEKVLRTAHGNNSTIRDRDVIRAIKNCADAGAQVVNISLGSTVYSQRLRNVIDRLFYNEGIIFIAAAGNHGLASGNDIPGYPAAFRNVLGVGAVNINGELANFSPAFTGLNLLAPGMDILSTIPQDIFKVRDVYFQSEEVYYPYPFTQIDNGTFEYPDVLPSQSSCYHYISDTTVEEQLTNRQLSAESRRDIRKASKQCLVDGGEVIVLTYDFLSLSEKPQFQEVNAWLASLEYEAKMPTLLMPGLNSHEIDLFRQGNMQIDAGLQGYAAYSGTSQAAAVVTAGIAKLWANFPDAATEQIIHAVKSSAKALQYDYPAKAVGNGLVDFSAAYSFLADYEQNYVASQCPAYWYDNQRYSKGDLVTYKGFSYEAIKRNKDERPFTVEGTSDVWSKVSACDGIEGYEPDYYDTELLPTYELSEVERIEVIFKCASYTLSCGGGSMGGIGGFSYTGGGAGVGSGGGEFVGGSPGNNGNGQLTPEQEKQKDEEHKDLRKRADNQPPKKPGESEEDYQKRLSKYYKKLAEDYKKWDKKWGQVGRHDTKVRDILERAKKAEIKYNNAVNHRLAKEGWRAPVGAVCKQKYPGRFKLINTLACKVAGMKQP